MATPPEKAKALDDDLRKPSREMLKSPLTGRIIEFSSPKHKMPSNVKIYDGTTDPDDHINRFTGARNQEGWLMQVWYRIFQRTLDDATMGWFDRLSAGCIDDSTELRKKSITRFATLRAFYKDLTKITKITWKVNESLPTFKGRRTTKLHPGCSKGYADLVFHECT
ncbi:hypothetical protein Tco_1040698 [Tanacetum coccineum]